jgi:hypothetical protein
MHLHARAHVARLSTSASGELCGPSLPPTLVVLTECARLQGRTNQPRHVHTNAMPLAPRQGAMRLPRSRCTGRSMRAPQLCVTSVPRSSKRRRGRWTVDGLLCVAALTLAAVCPVASGPQRDDTVRPALVASSLVRDTLVLATSLSSLPPIASCVWR